MRKGSGSGSGSVRGGGEWEGRRGSGRRLGSGWGEYSLSNETENLPLMKFLPFKQLS